jgi:hypothetical protein
VEYYPPTTNLAQFGSQAYQPQPIADMSTTNETFGLQDQGTSETFFHDGVFRQNFHDASTRPILDVDVEMDESLQTYSGHAPALTTVDRMPLYEIPQLAFSTQTIPASDTSQYAPLFSAFEQNQFTHPIQFHYADNGHQGQNQNDFGLSPNQLNLPFLSTSSNVFGTFVGSFIFPTNWGTNTRDSVRT